MIVILPEWLHLILYCLFGNSSVTVPDLFHQCISLLLGSWINTFEAKGISGNSLEDLFVSGQELFPGPLMLISILCVDDGVFHSWVNSHRDFYKAEAELCWIESLVKGYFYNNAFATLSWSIVPPEETLSWMILLVVFNFNFALPFDYGYSAEDIWCLTSHFLRNVWKDWEVNCGPPICAYFFRDS